MAAVSFALLSTSPPPDCSSGGALRQAGRARSLLPAGNVHRTLLPVRSDGQRAARFFFWPAVGCMHPSLLQPRHKPFTRAA